MAGLGAGGGAGGGGPLAGLASAVIGNGLLAIAAGLIVGVVGTGTLLATGTVHVGGAATAPATSGPGLELVACPAVGPVIGKIPQGEKVLVTGRTADSAWLQIYYPGPAFDRAWTKAGPLTLEADPTGLPIASCEAPATPSPRPTPGSSTALAASSEPSPSAAPPPSAAASPSASPSAGASPSPSPSLAPSPSPNTPPVVSGLTASTRTLSYDQGAYCPTAAKTVTFSVSAADAGAVASATLFWRKPGATAYTPASMTLTSGTPQSGTWTVTLGSAANGITTAGRLTFYAVAQDASALSARSPATGTQVITVNVCVNTGPTFASGPNEGNTTLYADPHNTGCGSPIGTEISATITDIDGVKSATLVFTDQAGTTVKRPMTPSANNLWTSFINANNDGTQGPGQFTWQVIATDSKGASTTSPSQSISAIRCDAPATFDFGSVTSPVYNDPACTPNVITLPVYASDRDNTDAGDTDSHRLQVVVAWRAANLRGLPTYSGTVQAVFQKGNYFVVSIPVPATWTLGLYSLTYSATSTDVYGGTSQSFTGKAQFSVYGCQSPLG